MDTLVKEFLLECMHWEIQSVSENTHFSGGTHDLMKCLPVIIFLRDACKFSEIFYILYFIARQCMTYNKYFRYLSKPTICTFN